jgi:hypothetical protein
MKYLTFIRHSESLPPIRAAGRTHGGDGRHS